MSLYNHPPHQLNPRPDPRRKNIQRILEPLPEQLQALAARMQRMEEQLRPRSS